MSDTSNDAEHAQKVLDEEAATVDPLGPEAPDHIAEVIVDADELGLEPTQPVPGHD